MKYRPEIDGLRTVAVLPVILFHAGFATFSGGFIGVDVFFVISGYLITSIILKDLEAGSFSFLEFYERRARRILPALFFVIICCIPFAWMWMMPLELKAFSTSVVAVTVFMSNILFWQQSGYFDTAAELKPLLHTWSLAVEEQFYIFFPIAMLIMWRYGRRNAVVTIALVAVISLALSEYESRQHPMFNFYWLPTRAWELAAGSLCAFAANKPIAAKNDVLSFAGLAAIIFAIFYFDSSTPFPSLYALVPVLGTCAIILYARQGTIVGSLLSSKAFVGVGLISYSAYLWHQPLFAFARIRSFTEPTWQVMLLLAVCSLVLAYFSWRYIEMPARKRGFFPLPDRKSVFASAAFMGVLMAGIGGAGHLTNGFEELKVGMMSADQRRIYRYLSYNESEEWKKGNQDGVCFYGSAQNGPAQDSFEFYKKEQCLKKSDNAPNWLLIGDSHAAHLYHGIVSNYANVNVMQATASGCRPLLGGTAKKRCSDLLDYVYKQFLPMNRVDGIILAGRWRDEDLELLEPTIQYLRQFSDKIIIVGPTVEYSQSLPKLLIEHPSIASSDFAPVDRFLDKSRLQLSDRMADMLADADAAFVDVVSVLCRDVHCQTMTPDRIPMSWDYGHYTLDGSSEVVRKLKAENLLRLD